MNFELEEIRRKTIKNNETSNREHETQLYKCVMISIQTVRREEQTTDEWDRFGFLSALIIVLYFQRIFCLYFFLNVLIASHCQ